MGDFFFSYIFQPAFICDVIVLSSLCLYAMLNPIHVYFLKEKYSLIASRPLYSENSYATDSMVKKKSNAILG